MKTYAFTKCLNKKQALLTVNALNTDGECYTARQNVGCSWILKPIKIQNGAIKGLGRASQTIELATAQRDESRRLNLWGGEMSPHPAAKSEVRSYWLCCGCVCICRQRLNPGMKFWGWRLGLNDSAHAQ